MDSLVRQLSRAIEELEAGYLLVVTGAGISRASGIATFRGSEPDAVWKQNDVNLATFDYFLRDPVGQWQWYLERFAALEGARPNPAHDALVALEQWHLARGGRFRLVTQNIDTLHEQAGSQEMIKVHGSSDLLRCSRAGCRMGSPAGSLSRTSIDFEPFVEEPVRANIPTCPVCGALLRAHVLFFDEYYTEHEDYRFDEVQRNAGEADLMLFVGTSFAVGVTELLLHLGTRGGLPVFSVDPAISRAPFWADVASLQAPAEDLLPAVCRELGLPLT